MFNIKEFTEQDVLDLGRTMSQVDHRRPEDQLEKKIRDIIKEKREAIKAKKLKLETASMADDEQVS